MSATGIFKSTGPSSPKTPPEGSLGIGLSDRAPAEGVVAPSAVNTGEGHVFSVAQIERDAGGVDRLAGVSMPTTTGRPTIPTTVVGTSGTTSKPYAVNGHAGLIT